LVINGRRYWRENEIVACQAARPRKVP